MRFNSALLVTTVALAAASFAYAQTGTSSAGLPDAPQATGAVLLHPNGPTVIFDTSMGRITCQFYQRQAPKAVANFIGLATGTIDWTDPATHKKMHRKPYYDGTIFHRVIPGFMVQGGTPQALAWATPATASMTSSTPT